VKSARAQLGWCSVLHVVNDGYIASLSLLVPFIAADLGLSYTQSGLLKTASHVAISAAQIPAGFLAEKTGEIFLLGLGSVWFSSSYIALLFAFGFPATLALILISGIGGGVYHPVGTAFVSSVSTKEKTGLAVGILNFFGDIGKILFPALAGFMVIQMGWRETFAALGSIGLIVSVLFLHAFRVEIHQRLPKRRGTPNHRREPNRASESRATNLPGWGIRDRKQFTLYSLVGMIDTSIRSAVMVFLGFYLIQSGVQENSVGWFLSLTFLGGAFGKLLCGMPVARLGVKRLIFLTEFLMLAGCFALPSIPSGWTMLCFLPVFGFFLNGTSSLLYIGLIPTLHEDRRSRGYSVFYTLNFVLAAISPLFFGLIADTWGLVAVFYAAGILMLAGLAVVGFLRKN
jgi:MFS family permease